MNAFYNIAWYVTRVAMALWFDIRIEGRENIPEQGGALVVCNHRFLKDPVVLAHAIPPRRKLHFMSKAEWFDNKPFGLLLSALGVFPINRGEADMAALEKAAGFIRGGEDWNGSQSDFQNCGSGNPGFRYLPGFKAQRQGGAGIPHQSGGSGAGAVLDCAVCL